jgi:hypothetical protein
MLRKLFLILSFLFNITMGLRCKSSSDCSSTQVCASRARWGVLPIGKWFCKNVRIVGAWEECNDNDIICEEGLTCKLQDMEEKELIPRLYKKCEGEKSISALSNLDPEHWGYGM